MKTKLLLPILWFMTTMLYAQTTSQSYIIKGILADSVSHEPVAYATIHIARKTSPEKAVKMLVTDTKGKFRETLPEKGEYILTLSSVGNVTVKRTFSTQGNEKIIDLGTIYTKEAVEELGGVTVVAQKPLVKVDIDKIAYDVEADPEAEAKTVLDMLRKVPLITVDGEDNIKLNGKSNFRIHLNGRPSNLLSNNPGKTLKSMPANAVKDIEVITNPGAKYDAEGVGGIINIVMQGGKGLEGYTATLSTGATTTGGWNAGINAIFKIGKFSISGNYHHYYNRISDISNHSQTEYYNNPDEHLLEASNHTKWKSPMDFGSAEASYELDSLNLLTFTISSYKSRQKQNLETYSKMMDVQGNEVYDYTSSDNKTYNYGGTEASLNYQRTLHKKDELLTVSYRFSRNPSGGKFYQRLISENPLYHYERKDDNDASTNEHTGQIDYVNPFNQLHTLETGLKYIYRNNTSETTYLRRKPEENAEWNPIYTNQGAFDHNQHILAGDAAYTLKYKKFGLKAGARAEYSMLKAYLHSETNPDFDADFFDIVPTGNLSFQLSNTQTLRGGYNMRIARPGIWYLNPYREETPRSVYYGNPHLKTEKYHNVEINFSSFTQKLMINTTLSYNYCNNSIERYTFLNSQNILEYTYGNIGKKQTLSLGLYANITLSFGMNIWMNGIVNYTDLRSKALNTTAYGWNGGGSLGFQQSLPWKLQLNVFGGYYSPNVQLQSKNVSYYYYGLMLSRSFFKDRLTITAQTYSPFEKYLYMHYSSYTNDFCSRSTQRQKQRTFNFSLSYRLGDLKTTVKKIARGIVNDDLKSGGSQQGQSSK